MLPELVTEIPGPVSRRLSGELREFECQNVTFVDEAWPIFWERAEGVNVWDADGNRYLDMTSAFGVAGLGHGHFTGVMREQSEKLIHAMGDVHPTKLKVEVCRLLSASTFEIWGAGKGKTTLSNSGFEAVETALKTAKLATNKDGIICFKNGYHGLGYGALLGGGMDKFRDPFASQLNAERILLDFPRVPEDLETMQTRMELIDAEAVGALLVEPIQGRGGKNVPPNGFLRLLREWCDKHGALLIFDEIYTGFNRTGKMFACEWQEVVPDLICLGKAMSGGFPISACVGKAKVMNHWPESPGEALHTSTFLGNPVGCAMSVAAIHKHMQPEIAENVTERGNVFQKMLSEINSSLIHEVRGKGLMLGIELIHDSGAHAGDLAGKVLVEMLREGIIMLADGEHGNVLAFTPPFDLTDDEMRYVAERLQRALDRVV